MKHMKQIRRIMTITIYLMSVLLSSVTMSCTAPTAPTVESVADEVIELLSEQDIEQEKDKEDIEEEPAADEILSEVDENIVEKEPTEEIMNLKPIENYAHYAFADGKLKGIGDDVAYPLSLQDSEGSVIPIDDFYMKDLALFFSVKVMEKGAAIPETDPVQYEAVEKTYYFTQVPSYDPVEITAAKFKKPDQQRVTMIEGKYKIQDKEYPSVPGGVVSNVEQVGIGNTSYLLIDGYCLDDKGLWFSVSDGYPNTAAKTGLYFYPVGESRVQWVGDYGRIF